MSRKKPTTLPTLRLRVRELMAERGVRTVSELSRRLEAIGVSISIAQLGRLADGKTDSWNTRVLAGLLVVLECDGKDLVSTKFDGVQAAPKA